MTIGDELKSFSEPVNKLLVPAATSIGNTLNDVWELVFGGFGTYVEKKRATRYKALQAFKASLENKVAQIPEENLCEPPLSVVGPALEASKYYYEEPELREMFANLISSTLDKDKFSTVHPSFVEIIKGMTSLDAQNLTLIDQAAPIVEYRLLKESTQEYKIMLTNVFLGNPSEPNLITQSQSISVLEHLGLVEITFKAALAPPVDYTLFAETEYYKNLVEETKEGPSGRKVEITLGGVRITPLGDCFKEVCCPQSSS